MSLTPPASGPRWLVPLFVNTVLAQVITFMLRPTTSYQALELNVPTHWLGALGASFALVPLLVAVPSGHAADRFGERRVMALGALMTVVAGAWLLLLGGTVWGLLGGSVFLGVGHLCSVVGQQAMMANRTSPDRYDSGFGHYTFAASAGQALGPGLIVLFGGDSVIPDTSAIFGWSTVLAVPLLLSALAIPSAASSGAQKSAEEAGGFQTLLRRPGLVRALSVSCVVLAAVDISLVYLPALGADRDITAGAIGVLLALRAVSSMTSRFFLGRLAACLGRGRLLTISVAAAAIGMALLPVPMPLGLLAAVVVLTGLGLGAGQPLTMSWLAEATPPGLRGRAMSLRLTGNRLGQVVVPSVAGLLAVGAGPAGVIWLTAGALAGVGLASRRLNTEPPPATDG
jgi:MFS family permease